MIQITLGLCEKKKIDLAYSGEFGLKMRSFFSILYIKTIVIFRTTNFFTIPLSFRKNGKSMGEQSSTHFRGGTTFLQKSSNGKILYSILFFLNTLQKQLSQGNRRKFS